MAADETIDLYAAVEQMRAISAAGGTFELTHRKWDRDRRTGGDIVTVPCARLRPKARDEDVANAGHKLFYTDTDTGRARNCWQCLIMGFNGKKVVIN